MKTTRVSFKRSQLLRTVLLLIVIGLIILPVPACKPADPYPLSLPGRYHVGFMKISTADQDRGSRQVEITVWYPAKSPGDSESAEPLKNAEPEARNAPYPLILSSTKIAEILAPKIVSYGFTWASVDKIDYWMSYSEQMIFQPQDILFALDLIADQPPDGLAGMIDSEHAGTLGYSFDGFNSLAMSGARIDPEFYLSQCADPDILDSSLQQGIRNWGYCALANKWDSFAAAAGKEITESSDGLWQPLTDPRIKAVMPMACDGWLMFGERGLAAVDRPILMIVAGDDEVYGENAMIYEHIGTDKRGLITFKGLGHMMILNSKQTGRIAHFAVAFFGYYLKGLKDYRKYFSEDFVNQHDELHWGIVN